MKKLKHGIVGAAILAATVAVVLAADSADGFLRVTMHSNPHFHSQDRHVTVIKGVWLMGVSDQADFRRAVSMETGSYAFHPARGVHWDGAGDEEAIVQIIGMGPVETTQVNPKAPLMGQWALPINK